MKTRRWHVLGGMGSRLPISFKPEQKGLAFPAEHLTAIRAVTGAPQYRDP